MNLEIPRSMNTSQTFFPANWRLFGQNLAWQQRYKAMASSRSKTPDRRGMYRLLPFCHLQHLRSFRRSLFLVVSVESELVFYDVVRLSKSCNKVWLRPGDI